MLTEGIPDSKTEGSTILLYLTHVAITAAEELQCLIAVAICTKEW
jgi:hypothetical protein